MFSLPLTPGEGRGEGLTVVGCRAQTKTVLSTFTLPLP